MKKIVLIACLILSSFNSFAADDYERAVKRAQYLFSGTMPTDKQLQKNASSSTKFRDYVRQLIEGDGFYDAVLRFHEKVFGTGLQLDYIDELRSLDSAENQNKFAKISCTRVWGSNPRLSCRWASVDNANEGQCPVADEQASSVFWYPGVVAWSCPSVIRACGHDLSRCFIQYDDEDAARNSELGATEVFDSRFSVIKSLSKQAAGIATRLTLDNYPYTNLMKSGLTAIDGAVSHLYKQKHHFKIDELKIPDSVLDIVNGVTLKNHQFVLVNTDSSYEQSGILSTFAWLRRYDKHRTRGNELYQRLMCRKFTSELPRVFPQDPGNLRKTPGCSGCHATLDPLSDFYKSWGEGGELYSAHARSIKTSFAGKSGSSLEDLGQIVAGDFAFATCTTMHVWEWLMGRMFYHEESALRAALTNYFINSDYSLQELIYAVATHPAFMAAERSDGTVTDPLEEPPLGEVPNEVSRECTTTIDYTADIAPSISMCTSCHNSSSSSRSDLSSESDWREWGSQAVGLMASGQMPPGKFGPTITAFKEKVRCWMEQQ